MFGARKRGEGVSDSVDLPEDVLSPLSVGVACPGFNLFITYNGLETKK